MRSQSQPQYCSLLARAAGVPLYGSTSPARVWLLLEYRRSWGAKVLPQSALAPPIKHFLSHTLAAIPESKLLFIKQPERFPKKHHTLFVAICRENRSRLFRFEFRRYADLLDLDIPAVAAENPARDSREWPGPLYLVCTNGKRDKCCAKFGLPLYRELAAQAGEAVWQCSHIGGHMYAPTFVSLPEGHCFGHVKPGEGESILKSLLQDELFLSRYRGRACYPKIVQAADYFLRDRQQRSHAKDFHFLGTERAEDRHTVRFRDRRDGREYRIVLHSIPADNETLKSCTPPKSGREMVYRLDTLETE